MIWMADVIIFPGLVAVVRINIDIPIGVAGGVDVLGIKLIIVQSLLILNVKVNGMEENQYLFVEMADLKALNSAMMGIRWIWMDAVTPVLHR